MDLPVVVLLMGVSGVGKTTVGKCVAERLGWAFFDADDFHPPANVAKMSRGEALTDADRGPWLRAVHALIERRLAEGHPAVVACSALRQSYRAQLEGSDPAVCIVWLDAPPDLLAERLSERRGHFAGPDLLASQLDTLEPPREGEALHAQSVGSVSEVADRVVAAIRGSNAPL